jgi:MerR family transcriptional regulator, copper efflux regulator
MNTTTQDSLKIGEVSVISGLPVKTIRYYEEIGLLSPTVERSQSGYRLFDEHVLSRLAFIKQAQTLGLSLSEIRAILGVHDRGELPCEEVKQHLQEKVQTLTEQINTLEMLRAELQKVLSNWQEQPSHNQLAETICPNLQKMNSFYEDQA